MLAAKVAEAQSFQTPQQQNRHTTMATGGASAGSGSLAVDAVPEGLRHTGGYALEIFEKKEDRDRFSCGFCERILRNPLQAECGHRYCADCQEPMEAKLSSSGSLVCKSCKEEGCSDEDSKIIPSKMFVDRGIRREMLHLRTKCPNEMCVWSGSFKDYAKHEEECKFKPMICDKCSMPISKQKMDSHKKSECPQRRIKCDHCKKEMAQAEKVDHLKQCAKVPELCNQCKEKRLPRDEMKKHIRQECMHRQVSCPIENCTSPQPYNKFHQHLQKDQPKHLAWAITRIQTLEDAVATLTTDISAGAIGSGASASGQTSNMAKVTGAVDILKNKVDQLAQQVQESLQHGGQVTEGATGGSDPAGAGAEVPASGGAVTERINAMEVKVNTLEPILSVLHGETNRCIGAIEALELKLQQETVLAREFREKIEQYEQTIQTMTTTQSQREAKLRELESRILNLSQDRADGTLLWRIPNFSKVRQDAMTGAVSNIHSRPFYTGSIGYKMCVRLYPNGDGMGKGTHLSLFFTLMRSNHDALLPWPFKQKVYFMLIDQNYKKHVVDAFRSEPNSSSFQKPTSEMNIATGCPLFMELSKLNQAGHGYLKDDTMYVRVVVETDGLNEHIKQFDPRSIPLASANTSS